MYLYEYDDEFLSIFADFLIFSRLNTPPKGKEQLKEEEEYNV